MRTATYKGRVLGNSLNIYNYYKQITGRGLQADVTNITRLTAINDKIESQGPESLTDQEFNELQKIDTIEVISSLYVALRKGGDNTVRNQAAEQIRDELDIDDINNPELLNVIVGLLSGKKE